MVHYYQAVMIKNVLMMMMMMVMMIILNVPLQKEPEFLPLWFC